MVGQFPYVLSAYMGDPSPADPRLRGNVFYAPTGDRIYALPPHNYTSTLPLTYINSSAGSYQLSIPTWTDTSDGKISGVSGAALPSTALPVPNGHTLVPSSYANPSGGNYQMPGSARPNTSDGKIAGVNGSTPTPTTLTVALKPLH